MDAVDAARELIPLPIRCANAVLFPLAVTVFAALVMSLANRLSRPRLPPEAHWTARAGEMFSGAMLLRRATLFSFVPALFLSAFYAGPVGCIGDAVTLLRAAASLEPEEPAYSIHLARALCRDGRTQEALETLEKAREQLRTRPDVEPWVIRLLESTQLSVEDGEAE